MDVLSTGLLLKKGCKLSFESGRKISTALMGGKRERVKPITVPKGNFS